MGHTVFQSSPPLRKAMVEAGLDVTGHLGVFPH